MEPTFDGWGLAIDGVENEELLLNSEETSSDEGDGQMVYNTYDDSYDIEDSDVKNFFYSDGKQSQRKIEMTNDKLSKIRRVNSEF